MELRRIQFCIGCGDDSCGGCDCNPQLNSFQQQIKGVQGVKGAQGAQGVAGKNNVLNGSELLDSNGGNQDGVDGSLTGGTTTAFSNAGFDLTTTPTMVATVDSSDIANTKYWARFSNSFLSWFGSSVIPKLLPSAGTSGNLLTSNGTIWTSATPVIEKYNTTSVTSLAITEALVGTYPTLTVDGGLAYRFGNPVRAVDIGNNDNYIEGVVESYTSVSLNFKVTKVAGGGTPASWKVGLGALQNVPYFSNTVGKNQFLTNNGQELSWGFSAFPVGSTIPWFGALASSAPTGWLKCNGAIILKDDYPELHALLSASTAFQIDENSCYLPNLIGKVPVGVDIGDANINAIGEAYGTKETTIVGNNLPVTAPYKMPDHRHLAPVGNDTYVTGKTGGSEGRGTGTNADTDAKSGYVDGGELLLTQNTGGGQPFSNFQPSIACIYIIKY
jgi:microcystin-dependent protein